ncbi:MAG: nucleotide exchange factor GrpE [Candidatus Stygibacter australis]|nr:nucleotide exchange factor GrpE [Candidatus Stygibacter australis]MDP8321005.1 nucleotide exchange factor GrpE [Candidatus Stygibacter australis]
MSETSKIDKKLKQEALQQEQQDLVEETTENEIVDVEIVDSTEETGLLEKIMQLEREKAEMKDKWLRSVAEFENFRRRSTVEKSTWIKNANQRLILELCDVTDNFERALAGDHDEGNAKHYQKGIEMIYNQISNILKREGVEKVETDKRDFNPEYHEALAHIPSELKENKIAATIQNGYLMNGKLIRAARVAVSNGEKPEKTADKKADKKKNRNRRI